MRGKSLVLCCLLAGFATPVAAQQWAEKMFDGLTCDFGGVARASKVEHRFRVKNIYKEEVHISGVRSSCGCTSVAIDKDTLKTYETGDIIATLNTRSFTGDRAATLTVTIDKPFYAEVQLRVTGYIRTDVVLDPPNIDFGSVSEGDAGEQRIAVAYAGRNDWKVLDLKNPSPLVDAEIVETSRGNGRVNYELIVKLKPGAPAGYVKDQLTLVTNDRRETEIPVDIEGRVTSAVSVTPASLFLGVVSSGKKVTKQLVVRAKQPFRILAVECEDQSFAFKHGEEAKELQMVPVTFTAGEAEGKITAQITIVTDIPGNEKLQCTAYAQVASTDVADDRLVPQTAKASLPGDK
jgi:hypothetical protein